MDLRDGGLSFLAKTLIWTGLGMAGLGACLWLGSRFLGERRLPGDIVYESDKLRVYLPLGTCLLLSAVLSALMWLFNKFR